MIMIYIKKSFPPLFLSIFLLSGIVLAISAQAIQFTFPTRDVAGLQIEINLDKEHYQTGELVTGSVTVTNPAEKPLETPFTLEIYKEDLLIREMKRTVRIPPGTRTVSLSRVLPFKPVIPKRPFVLGEWKAVLKAGKNSAISKDTFFITEKPLLSLNFNQDFKGADGEMATKTISVNITSLDEGIEGNTVSLSSNSDLNYVSGLDNFNKDSGTLEFWFKPMTWHTDGQVIHRFFDVRFQCDVKDCLNYMILDVDNYNKKILFKINDYQGPFILEEAGSREKQSIYSFNKIAYLQWHHLAVTWDKNKGSKLYFNGKLVGRNTKPYSFKNPISDLIFSSSEDTPVGKIAPGSNVDVLMVYNYPKTSREIAYNYKALKDPVYVFKTKDTKLGFKISSGRLVSSLLSKIDANIAGQDGGYSLPYKGKSLWFFGDTTLTNGGLVMNNTFAETQDLNASDGISLKYKKDTQGNPVAVITPQPPKEDLIWPQGMVEKDGIVYAFSVAVKIDPLKVFLTVGEVWSKSTAPITDINQATFIRTSAYWPSDASYNPHGPGLPVYDGGDWIYFIGSDPPKDKAGILARVLKKEIENISAYQYWTGTNWVSDRAQGINILYPALYDETNWSAYDEVNSITINWNSYLNKWLMILPAQDSYRTAIVARTADSITGPWSEDKILVECPPDNFIACYQIKWHPEYDRNRGQRIYITTANWQRYQLYLLELNLRRL